MLYVTVHHWEECVLCIPGMSQSHWCGRHCLSSAHLLAGIGWGTLGSAGLLAVLLAVLGVALAVDAVRLLLRLLLGLLGLLLVGGRDGPCWLLALLGVAWRQQACPHGAPIALLVVPCSSSL